MNQYYVCIHCSAENEIGLDLAQGESQHLVAVCDACSQVTVIDARYNYAVNEFELELTAEDDS